MRWYQKLIAEKYDGSQNRVYAGRPPIREEIVNLVIRFKQENPRWGYRKIRDQVVYLGYAISKSSVKNILIENGYDPEPDLNCYAERFVKSVKSECLDHLILSSVEQLEYVLGQYNEYYHHERIHQSLDRIIEPKHIIDDKAEIVCIKRLGGLLKSYHRLAA